MDADLLFAHCTLPNSFAYSLYNIAGVLSSAEPISDVYISALSGSELAEANRITHKQERARRLMARALLRIEIGALLDISPRLLAFVRAPHGKPYIPFENSTRICFNLSHSGDFIAIATGATEVGIDIEQHRDLDCMEEVARDCFDAKEYHFLQNGGTAEKQERFFSLWTRKEALLKGMGSGFQLPHNGKARQRSKALEDGWKISSIFAPGGYSAAIACRPSRHPTTGCMSLIDGRG